MSFSEFVCGHSSYESFSLRTTETEKILGGIPAEQLLKEITDIVIEQQSESLRILSEIEKKLEKEIFILLMKSKFLKNKRILFTIFLFKR
jgi:polyphosphate kinase